MTHNQNHHTQTSVKKVVEINCDGLAGPTHHYGGLAFGNIASEDHKGQVSSPREAALQGLKKMKWCTDQLNSVEVGDFHPGMFEILTKYWIKDCFVVKINRRKKLFVLL